MDIPLRVSSFKVDEADRLGEELESVLNGIGVSIKPGSDVERMCLAPSEIVNYVAGQGISSDATYRQYVDAATLAELATRIVTARGHPSFATLLPHLELLNQGDPRQAGRARETDQAARKLFELFTALLAMRFSNSVELEHPVRGSDGNPDVVVEFGGQRWGIACKVPTSANPESLAQNLDKAVSQVVEAGVHAGVVMFNLKNVIPPESYWKADPEDPTARRFVLVREPAELPKRAIKDVENLWRGVESHVGPDVFKTLLLRPPCAPVVLSYLQVMAPVVHDDDVIAATTSRFVACYQIGSRSMQEEAFISALHKSAVDAAA
jgi:hypothetical protein